MEDTPRVAPLATPKLDCLTPARLPDLPVWQQVDNHLHTPKLAMHMWWRVIVRERDKPDAVECLRSHAFSLAVNRYPSRFSIDDPSYQSAYGVFLTMCRFQSLAPSVHQTGPRLAQPSLGVVHGRARIFLRPGIPRAHSHALLPPRLHQLPDGLLPHVAVEGRVGTAPQTFSHHEISAIRCNRQRLPVFSHQGIIPAPPRSKSVKT